jgi:hypothetical protein
MNASKLTVLLLVLLPNVAFAQHKTKKPIVPAVFNHARYVYVEAVDGQEFDPRLNPDDLQAIANVRDALGQWNRYALTTRREDADIVIVVCKGRAVEARAGVIIGSGPASGSGTGPQGNPSPGQPGGQSGTGFGTVGGGELGTPDDLFEVCQLNPDDTMSTPIWMRTFPDGLDRPRVMLFEQFKNAVDKAYPTQPANQTANQAPKP